MSKRVMAALVVLLIAGGVGQLLANGTYVITDKWWGFVTDTKSVRKGMNITADEIHKSVAAGGKYALINDILAHPYVLLSPAEKIAPYAGQTVWVTGSITTHSLLKSNRVIEDSDGGGGDSGSFTIAVTQITPAK